MRALFALLATACAAANDPAPRDPRSLPAAPAAPTVSSAAGSAPAPAAAQHDPQPTSPPALAKTESDQALPEIPEDMLPVSGGEFAMGSDSEGEPDERPAHRVRVESFLLDRTEVTNRDHAACVKAGACKPLAAVAQSFGANDRDFRAEQQPVVGASWFEAKAYCEFRGKRLPREAEWERAARGDDGRRYAWGNQPPDPHTLACYGRKPGAAGGTTMPVGSYPAGQGPYGHLDLTGNVWEWMEDVYDPYAYRRPSSAQGVPGNCTEVLATQDELRQSGQQGFTGKNPIPTVCERVLRGGAFNYRGEGLRASNRVHHPPEWHILVAGFRCARDL